MVCEIQRIRNVVCRKKVSISRRQLKHNAESIVLVKERNSPLSLKRYKNVATYIDKYNNVLNRT